MKRYLSASRVGRFVFTLPFLVLAPVGVSAADSILVLNPSFQADTFPNFPGYIGGGNPAAISGWVGVGGVGINNSGGPPGSPFGDNGAYPDNNQIAFLQGAASLSQTLSGFSVGQQYWFQGFANARNCCGDIPIASVTLGANTLLPPTPVTPVGGANPYYFVNIPFTPAAGTETLTISSVPSAGGDASLVIDGISVIRRDNTHLVIANPSFEAGGTGLPFPGYVGNLAGWTRSGNGGTGYNEAGGPFANNGAIPDGLNVLLLQNDVAVSQTVNGFTLGQLYELSLDYNSRVFMQDPHARVTIGGYTALDTDVAPVGGSNPYNHLSYSFVATSPSMLLTIENTRGGVGNDSTLLIDNVAIRLVPEPSTVGLMALGLGLVLMRWTRRS